MNKFEKIIKEIAGHDSHEVKDLKSADIRWDIRERAKFPAEIQEILSKIDRLDEEENKLRTNISELRENSNNKEDKAIIQNLDEQLIDVENRQREIYRDLNEILSKDKELHESFLQYMAKKADKKNPEGLKFSQN